VAQVVEAIEGPLMLTACDDQSDNCEQFTKCSIRDPLHRIREQIVSALGACSIEELAGTHESLSKAAIQPVPVRLHAGPPR